MLDLSRIKRLKFTLAIGLFFLISIIFLWNTDSTNSDVFERPARSDAHIQAKDSGNSRAGEENVRTQNRQSRLEMLRRIKKKPGTQSR